MILNVQNKAMCFRPLSGIKVSELVGYLLMKIAILVFVPSRGLRYLNLEAQAKELEAECFRPLSGIKVSEHI